MLLRWVLIRDPNGKFKAQALFCTDPHVSPEQIVQWFILRWQLEVTLEEVRAHLGVETQRQWSDKAIARTTPALLGLFSLVTLLAQQSVKCGTLPVRQAACYAKTAPTFSGVLAIVLLLVYIFLPLVIGLALQRFLKERSVIWGRVSLQLMRVLLGILVVSAVLLYRETLAALVLSATTVLILVLQFLSLGLGYLLGGPLGAGRRALAVTAVVRSSATALLIAAQVYAAQPLVASTVILYGVLALVVSSLAAIAMAWNYSRTPTPAS